MASGRVVAADGPGVAGVAGEAGDGDVDLGDGALVHIVRHFGAEAVTGGLSPHFTKSHGRYPSFSAALSQAGACLA